MDVTFGPNQAGAKCAEKSFDRAQLKREGDGADKVKVSMPVKDAAVSGLFSVQMAMVVIGRSLACGAHACCDFQSTVCLANDPQDLLASIAKLETNGSGP